MAFSPFPQPIGTRACDRFRLWIAGRECAVLNAPVSSDSDHASFATYTLQEPADVEVRAGWEVSSAEAHPGSLGLACEVDGHAVRFRLERGRNVALEVDGRWLYLFHVEPSEPPTRDVLRFESGAVHRAGVIELRSGQTLWIEPGAIVQGVVRARGAENAHIGGGGVLDCGGGELPADWGRMVILDGCRGCTISDVTLVRPRTWMVTLGGCEDVEVRNLHEIGSCVGSDGIDVVGSRRVRVVGGLLRNNDDCLVVKAFDPRPWMPDVAGDWSQDVRDVVFEGLTVANDAAGNGLEIGHELRTDSVSGITFRDIDILHVHGHGAPFSINCGDHATVSDVLYEDVRVWHHYDKLVSLRVMRSRFNKDEERGRIRGVTFRKVRVREQPYNPGYTISVIGGWDESHRVEGVLFEDFRLGDRPVRSLMDLDAYVRHIGEVRFA